MSEDRVPPPDPRGAVLDTFIAGLDAEGAVAVSAGLHAGTPLALRRREPRPGQARVIEVCTLDGQRLGHLPPADHQTLDAVAGPGAPLAARVSAVVPGYQRPRVLLSVTILAAARHDDGVAAPARRGDRETVAAEAPGAPRRA